MKQQVKPLPEAEAKTAEEVLDRLLTGFDWPHWSKKNALKAMQEYAELYSKKSEERVRARIKELEEENETIDYSKKQEWFTPAFEAGKGVKINMTYL